MNKYKVDFAYETFESCSSDEEKEVPSTPLYTIAEVDTESGLDDYYHPSLLNPTPEMLEAHLATERPEGIDTCLDAVARLGLISGTELNAVFREAVRHIEKTGVCPDKTLTMLHYDILRFPLNKRMGPVKKAVILFTLWLFPEMQQEFSEGDIGGGVRHERIDKETLNMFVRGGLKEAIDPFLKCMVTPHQFVDQVMKMVEEGGVHGYLQRSLHA